MCTQSNSHVTEKTQYTIQDGGFSYSRYHLAQCPVRIQDTVNLELIYIPTNWVINLVIKLGSEKMDSFP